MAAYPKARRRPAKVESLPCQEIRSLYESGKPLGQLSKMYNVSRLAIARAVTHANGKLRSKAGSTSLAHTGKIVSAESVTKLSQTKKLLYQSCEKRRQELLKASKKGADAIRLTDTEREVRAQVRRRASNMLHRAFLVMGKRKNGRTEEVLGYSRQALRAHIESKFAPEMSWENSSSFVIDHVVPVVAFLKRGIYDLRLINALENLQPLTPEENRFKSYTYNDSDWIKDYSRIYMSVYGNALCLQ